MSHLKLIWFFRILNKLTPEKFDKLSLELLNVGISDSDILKGIILLVCIAYIYNNLLCTFCVCVILLVCSVVWYVFYICMYVVQHVFSCFYY